MSAINHFALSGMWDHRNVIVPVAVGLPLATEGAILAKNIYQKPHVVQEKLQKFKTKVIESFTFHPGETRFDGMMRIIKNCLILLSALACMAIAAYFCITLLPHSFGITAAISLIFLIGKLFCNASEYKRQLIDAFKAREGEDVDEAKKRIRKNIFKAIAIAIVAAAAIAIGTYILTLVLAKGFMWQLPLPLQTKGVVFAEYASLGLLHGGLAYHKWKKGDKWGALFHLFSAALSFIFPAYYWNHDMRLHHSFYGLLLMAAPCRPLQFLGGMITFDSALYFLEPWRGYVTNSQWGPRLHEYDFINSIVDNAPLFAGTYTGAMIAHNINSNFEINSASQVLALPVHGNRA